MLLLYWLLFSQLWGDALQEQVKVRGFTLLQSWVSNHHGSRSRRGMKMAVLFLLSLVLVQDPNPRVMMPTCRVGPANSVNPIWPPYRHTRGWCPRWLWTCEISNHHQLSHGPNKLSTLLGGRWASPRALAGYRCFRACSYNSWSLCALFCFTWTCHLIWT